MRIIIPTERERKANYSYAWTGYHRLDPAAIEEADKRESFFVNGWDFTELSRRCTCWVSTPRPAVTPGIAYARHLARHMCDHFVKVEMQWRERNR